MTTIVDELSKLLTHLLKTLNTGKSIIKCLETIQYIHNQDITSISDIAKNVGINYPTLKKCLNILEKIKYVKVSIVGKTTLIVRTDGMKDYTMLEPIIKKIIHDYYT